MLCYYNIIREEADVPRLIFYNRTIMHMAMPLRDDVLESLKTHPCYNEEAHKTCARMHLPVAPRCNIQCNYCNRKYDCSNESRPGVTSEVLSPREAVEKVRMVKERIPELKVIAIAGPGDPLANDETFTVMEMIRREFPEMTLCISTNGLMLPDNAKRLFDIGIGFVTVTMNGIDTDVTERIYDRVIWNGESLKGKKAAERLLENQLEGIRRCVELGMAVKINVVLIPGINEQHIPDLVKKVKDMGVYIVNILPLIPVEGTKFSDMEPPTPESRKRLMDLCAGDVKMMRHCRQCRADAIGLLGEDRSSEFIRTNPCGSGCGPRTDINVRIDAGKTVGTVAVASELGEKVDGGFGNSRRFVIYRTDGRDATFVKELNVDTDIKVYGGSHAEHIEAVVEMLSECDAVVVKEIGPMPLSLLQSKGKRVLIFDGDVKEAVMNASRL